MEEYIYGPAHVDVLVASEGELAEGAGVKEVMACGIVHYALFPRSGRAEEQDCGTTGGGRGSQNTHRPIAGPPLKGGRSAS